MYVFVGDIGGSMGLFLGASLLSLCEMLDLVWTNLFKTKRPHSHKAMMVKPASLNHISGIH